MYKQKKSDDQALLEFWSKAFLMSEEEKAEASETGADSWKEMAPSEKLLRAAVSLGSCSRVLDYGCGNGWAAVTAAKSGCPDVTAADTAEGAAEAARFTAALFGVKNQVHVMHITADWLKTVPAETFDGLICSNVLDVVPPDTAETILREAARVVTPDAKVVIGMNYYLSPEEAAVKGLTLTDGCRLYLDGVLRLVSRTDAEWAEIFSPYFTVESLEYFAWPGEEKKRRRLFRLRRRETAEI